MCLTSITSLDFFWSWHQKCFHWYKEKKKTKQKKSCTVNARDLFNIFFKLFPVLDQGDSTKKKLPASTLQKTLAGQQRRALILWKRRFLTWHFPVVWRGLERDFCELSWLLQINSSSLSLSLSLSLSETTGVAFEPDKTRVPLHLTSEKLSTPTKSQSVKEDTEESV